MKFEDMDVWKKSVQLSTDIYLMNRNIRDYGFRDQIARSALSVPSNIADKIAGANFECRSLRRQPER